MKFMGTVKYKIGELVLRKKVKHLKRRVSSCNLKEAENIGILFDATHLVSFEVVKKFVKQIDSKYNTISILGYVDSKQLIDHYLYRKGFDFFTQANLNWYSKPEGEAVESFMAKEFDVLFDLNLEDQFPMKYILSLSKATFKAGRYTESHDFLDFMINIEPEIEAIKDLQSEIDKDRNLTNEKSSYENIANKKTDIELQLNFLINQLIHYLSMLKRKSS